ncbi:hypothetical protein CLU94_4984 [Janthinobacterium sp. 13]|nr:hypothetical protein CLU94_4984 [Janthinobacterium sp. 13]
MFFHGNGACTFCFLMNLTNLLNIRSCRSQSSNTMPGYGAARQAASRCARLPAWASSRWPSGSRKYRESPALRFCCHSGTPAARRRAAKAAKSSGAMEKVHIGRAGQRGRALSIQRQAQPQIPGRQIRAPVPARMQAQAQGVAVKGHAARQVAHGQGEVVQAGQHDGLAFFQVEGEGSGCAARAGSLTTTVPAMKSCRARRFLLNNSTTNSL